MPKLPVRPPPPAASAALPTAPATVITGRGGGAARRGDRPTLVAFGFYLRAIKFTAFTSRVY